MKKGDGWHSERVARVFDPSGQGLRSQGRGGQKREGDVSGAGVVVVLPNKGVDDEAVFYFLCLFALLLCHGPRSQTTSTSSFTKSRLSSNRARE